MQEDFDLKTDCFPLGGREIFPHFTLLGERVIHRVYGEGMIIAMNDCEDCITIAFGEKSKMFLYPDAFEHFLRFENEEYQESITLYFKARQREREGKKKEKKKRDPHLKYDPVEDTLYFMQIEEEVNRLVKKEIGEGGYLGYCHMYWSVKQRILEEKYGIDWRTPSELNPEVLFD